MPTPEVLVSAIRERLDEIERVARGAGAPDEGSWQIWHHRCQEWDPCEQPCELAERCTAGRCDHCVIEGAKDDADIRIYDEGGHSPAQAEHIVLHDPSSVLRRVQADRQIIEQYEAALGALAAQKEWWDARRRGEPEDDGGEWTDRMVDGWKARGAAEALLPVICDLADGLGIELPEDTGGDDG